MFCRPVLGLDEEFGKLRVTEQSQQSVKKDYLAAKQLVQCVINPNTKQQIPLKCLEFNVNINNSVAEVQVSQQYENESNDVIETEFNFAITARAAFHSLKVLFEDRIVVGVIKEKEKAHEEYKQGIVEGKTMVYSNVDRENPDIMTVKLGNLLPHQSMTVLLCYVEELDVCINKFWRLSLVTTTTPRYSPSYQVQQINEFHSQTYPLRIFIQINSSSNIAFLRSPTHKIVSEHDQHSARVQLDESERFYVPNKDFILLYADENINKPQVLLSKASFRDPYCAQLTFIPNFNRLTYDDAYRQYVEDNNIESDEFTIDNKFKRGEYIFLIDRSGSMEGNRIEKAKEALLLFIKSLPIDSYFNVYSFGSHFTKLFQTSTKYSKDTVQQSVSQIQGFQADYGGTELYEAMIEILTSVDRIPGYASKPLPHTIGNIFVLTDGAVSNGPETIGIIRIYSNPDLRVYTLGIGDGVSRYLVEMAAEAGGGMYEFVSDGENLNAKVMNLLQDSITPYLSQVSLEIDPQYVQSIVPDPQTYRGLRKNKPFTIYITLNAAAPPQTNLQLNYAINDENQASTSIQINLTNPIETKVFHQIAAHKLIQNMIQVAKYDMQSVGVLLNKQSSLTLKDIVNTSLEFGVLSIYTAFICSVSDNQDDVKQQQILNANKTKIIIPTITSQPVQQFGGQQFGSIGYPVPAPFMPMSATRSSPRVMSSQPKCFDPTLDLLSYQPPPAFQAPPPPPAFSAPPPPQTNKIQQIWDQVKTTMKSITSNIGSNQKYDEDFMQPESCSLEPRSANLECLDLMDMQQEASVSDEDQNDNEEVQQQQFQPSNQQLKEFKSSTSPVTTSFMEIIMLQEIDGRFIFNSSTLCKLQVNSDTFKNLNQRMYKNFITQRFGTNNMDNLFTALVLAWLEVKQKNEKTSWNLVYRKGLEYLQSQQFNYKELKQEIIMLL